MGCKKLIDNGTVDVFSGVVTMPVVLIEFLVFTRYGIENSVSGFWWNDVVLKSDIDYDRARDFVGKRDAVKVRYSPLNVGSSFRVSVQIIIDLMERVCVC